MFISNNRALFHLWGEGNLVKHQKVSKYIANGCSLKNDHMLFQEYTPFKFVCLLHIGQSSLTAFQRESRKNNNKLRKFPKSQENCKSSKSRFEIYWLL